MGRALRIRKRRKKRSSCDSSLSNSNKCNDEYIQLIKWMKEFGWKPTCKLISVCFEETGRGLMAKEKIVAGSAIAKIPFKLMITVKTVLQSQIRWMFTDKNVYGTQQVLSCFLIWERHLEKASVWKTYISCLPKTFSSPIFCEDVSWLPNSLRECVQSAKDKINKTYNFICSLLERRHCSHCGVPLSSVFTYDSYVWAWCVVNTRAVYLCPEINVQKDIILSDENNLALAPYVDLFNHTYDAEVKAYVIEVEGVYQIETGVPFSKNQQIFINYGPHSNEKLFVEYGFIIPSNIQDSVTITCENILNVVNESVPRNKCVNEFRYKFIKQKKLFEKVCCYVDGLSWDCQALIYVFLCSPEKKIEEIKQNIFSSKFKVLFWKDICKVALTIIKSKIDQYEQELGRLNQCEKNVRINEECFSVACCLLNEHIKLLEKCLVSLSKSDICTDE